MNIINGIKSITYNHLAPLLDSIGILKNENELLLHQFEINRQENKTLHCVLMKNRIQSPTTQTEEVTRELHMPKANTIDPPRHMVFEKYPSL